MRQEENPVVKELADQLSEPETRMLNALEAAYKLLQSEAEALYQAGAGPQAAELDIAAEDIIIRVEEIAEEVLGEGGGPLEGSEFDLAGFEIEDSSLEEDLASAYHEWVQMERGDPAWVAAGRFDSREEFIQLLRNIAHYHPSLSQPLDESVTGEQLFESARDAYYARQRRRRALG